MKSLYQASILLMMMTIISGIIYPSIVTGFGQLFWAEKTNGSLVTKDSKVVGSSLIAQEFKEQKYFWSRPSANGFNALLSGASNLGPSSEKLAQVIEQRRQALAQVNNVDASSIPADLLTASGSGLDPHISLAAARLQVKRIVAARGLDKAGEMAIHKLIDKHLHAKQLWIFGEERINVLLLNFDLDSVL